MLVRSKVALVGEGVVMAAGMAGLSATTASAAGGIPNTNPPPPGHHAKSVVTTIPAPHDPCTIRGSVNRPQLRPTKKPCPPRVGDADRELTDKIDKIPSTQPSSPRSKPTLTRV